MKTIRRFVVASVLAGLVAPVAFAGVSSEDAISACKTEAAARYAQGGQLVRVKLKGMYGTAAVRKVRVQVLPAEGKPFLALCEVDGKSGGVVSLQPGTGAAPAIAATGG